MTTHNEEEITNQITPNAVAGVRFHEIGKLYHFNCDHLPDLKVGEFVIVETARGLQMGQVMNLVSPEETEETREYKPVLRRATPTDLMSDKLWKAREVEALITCREKAAEFGGFENAKFVQAQYNFDGSLLTVLYTAEDKLNPNKLRSQIQRSFKAKVELRQVGPRDVAKVLGGMGACGIPRCCSTFLTDFSPISIKMAKAQGISLNPSEITGMCGRLRCCLIYEYEQYVEARKQLPKRNKRIGTPHGEGKVLDVHPLRDAVTVLVEDQRHIVEREDIIPLDEWLALKEKAEAGCSKHGDEPGDCGARPGKAESAAAQAPTAVVQESAPDTGNQDDAPKADHHHKVHHQGQQTDEKEGASNRRRSSGRRKRGGRSRRGRGGNPRGQRGGSEKSSDGSGGGNQGS